ncbi:DUF7282 domain-containing protein [Halorientalis pallida]|uniref:DUF7282 domain-containing protein n=1 Tax=Halorientalis pallida TaxID=2479928 RepID=UPI003C7059A4
MATVTRALPALCLVLAVLALGALGVATGTAVQTDDQTANETRGNESTRSVNGTTVTNATTADENASVTVGNVTVWTGKPAIRDRLDDWAAFERATEHGTLTRKPWLLWNDTLVLQLNATGLDRRLAAANGSNLTMRFFDATHGPDSALTLRQSYSTAERDPIGALLNQTAATSVIADTANDSYALVVDLRRLRGERVDDDEIPRPVQPVPDYYPTFGLNVTLDGHTSLFRPDQYGRPILFRVPDLDARVVTRARSRPTGLPPRENQSLLIEGSVPTGVNVTLRLGNRSDGGPPLRRTVRARGGRIDDEFMHMEWNTSETTTVDLSGLAAGTTFEILVSARGHLIDRVDGSIRPRSRFITAPERINWQDGQVVVPHLTLRRDGYLVAMQGNWSGLAWPEAMHADQYLGHTALDAGVHENVTVETPDVLYEGRTRNPEQPVTLVAVVEANENGRYDPGDHQYVENGRLVAATVPSIYSDLTGDGEAWNSTDPQGPRPPLTPITETRTVTTTDPPSATPTGPATTTGENGPGFGVLATVAAVLALFLLATRRD